MFFWSKCIKFFRKDLRCDDCVQKNRSKWFNSNLFCLVTCDLEIKKNCSEEELPASFSSNYSKTKRIAVLIRVLRQQQK